MSPSTTTSTVLNVAVIGCGEVAQIAHIPNIILASHLFKLTALCDVSAQALAHCGEKFSIAPEARFTDLSTLLSSSLPIDLVFILTADPIHAEHTILSLRAGKHVFLEKPMAQTLAECDAIEAAREESGKVVFVGYMRRYAGAMDRVKEVLKGREGEIKYVRVRDIIGNNKYFTAQSGAYQLYPTDLPQSLSAELEAKRRQNLIENIGADLASDPRNAVSWGTLTSLGSHDLSAMREVLGSPRGVTSAVRSGMEGGARGWWGITFDYGHFKAYYETAIDDVPLFDAHIEVYTGNERIKIQYDSPYIKGLPITMTIQSRLPNGDYSTQTTRPTYEDPYTLELRELYACIVDTGTGTGVKEVRTSVKDARRDTELVIEIIKALKD